jgi:hypothetical protein
VQFERTRWSWKIIQENLRSEREQSARTTNGSDASDPLPPDEPTIARLGIEPELYATLAKVENRSRHVVVPALVLEHRVAMGRAEHVGYACGFVRSVRSPGM